MKIPAKWQAEIDKGTAFGRKAQAALNRVPQTQQPVASPRLSTVGTQLKAAFEAAMSHAISCGTCLGYLRSLDLTATHDRNKIIDSLTANLTIPAAIRSKHKTSKQIRAWVASIVATVLGDAPVGVVPPATQMSVDVIIPFCAGDAKYLAECLQGIAEQQHVTMTVHVVADACEWPDIPDYEFVRRYQNNQRQGPYRIANSLVRHGHVQSDWIAIQDADDIAHPDRLWRQISMMLQTGAEMISSAMTNYIDPQCGGDKLTAELRNVPILLPYRIYDSSPLGCCVNGTRTMRRSLFTRLNGFATLNCTADFEFDNRCRFLGIKIIDDQTILARRRLHTSSMTHGDWRMGSPKRIEDNNTVFANLIQIRETPTLECAQSFGGLDKAQCIEYAPAMVTRHGEKPQPARTRQPVTQFVWPYWHAGANGDEIRWSVRSVETFFRGPTQCVIVGDRPPWFTGPVIECPRIEASGASRTYRPALRDMLNKMHAIVSSPEITDEFVWMMDDVYFVKHVTLDDLKTPRANRWTQRSDNAWQRVKTATMELMKSSGKPQLDYATHLPHVVEKTKLAEILHQYPGDMLWENIYGNMHRNSPQSVEPFLKRFNHKMGSAQQFKAAMQTATVVNNDVGAWCPALRNTLRDLMTNPASVENTNLVAIPHLMLIQASYSDADLSARRLAIAMHTSIPSLAYQTRKPVIHLCSNPNDPHASARADAFRATGCEVKVIERPDWKLYGEDWELPAGRKLVSRMDDDDVICKEFCEATYAAAPDFGEQALIWPNGYVFWREQIFQMAHPGNQFVSIVTDKQADPHQMRHHMYAKTWKTKVVRHNVGWIWVRHGDAATSTIHKYRKRRVGRIDSKRIPINLRAIIRAIADSGTASGSYAEHRSAAWAHVTSETERVINAQ